jgi:hypothetical protein
MRLLKALKGLFIGASAAAAAAAYGGAAIETNSLRLTLPDRWTPDLRSKPISAKGPRGELLHLSSADLSGQGSPQEKRAVMQKVEERALAAMQAAEKDSGFKVTTPLKTEKLPNGRNFHRSVATSRDGTKLLASFVAVGPQTVVLATLDLPSSSVASIEAIEASLKGIQWLQ